ADNDLDDQTADTAANELAGKDADIHTAGCGVSRCPKQRSEHGSTANTANGPGNQVAERAKVRVLQYLSTGCPTSRTA
ncbi:hypothetical protein, partial [Staphylococcus aureus]|uniref:hypothetical protein n=1 Tax=Staphylococcus aureus TaxID=1280 RepID=UPI0038B40AF8